MYKSLLVALLSTFALVRSSASEKCTAELAGIVYAPETYARDYMLKVAANFNIGSAMLFTPNAQSYIDSFEQQWGVTVEIGEPFAICRVSDDDITACGHSSMSSTINFPGFTYSSTTQNVYLTEDIFDSSGQMIQVTIIRSIEGIFFKK
jgi:hypothetical protein